MKNLKQFFLLFVLMSMVGAQAFAYDAEIDGIYYNLSDNGAEVTRNKDVKYVGEVKIPSSVSYNGKTYRVTGILNDAFSGCTDLTSIKIPNSVTSIGDGAFSGCSSLTSIEIPNSVTSIGFWAFRGCTGLTSIGIPKSITSIVDGAFQGCSGLTSIKVESGNTVYDSRNNCNAIIETNTNTLIAGCKNTVIPNSVTTLSYTAFNGCSSLTSIKIPNSVTIIRGSAFWDCPGLTSITVESGNTVFDSRNNCNAIIETNSNTLITGCKNTVIPNSVTGIGDGAFYGCSSLTSIEIPNNVTSIDGRAFEGCDALTSVTIGTSEVPSCFSGLKNLQSVTLLDGVTKIGNSAFSNCSGITSIVIPNSVTSIGGSSFRGCVGLTSIEIPNSVTSIGASAFYGCTNLTAVDIPSSVTSIGNLAFAYCNNLKLSIGTETVGTWFKGLSNLTSVTFKNSVKTIADNAFKDCSGLSSIVIPNSVTSIGNDAFSGCDEITTLNIGMSEIGTWFRGLRKLASVTMTYGVKYIDDYAFSGCHIKNLTIPRSVTGIGSAAFSGVDTLTIGMSRIETWFKGKSWLSTLVLTSSVETIEPEAFSGCKDLNNVKMYNGVTSIGTKAFYNCRSLTSVILSNNLKTIEDEAFSSCTSLSEIKIPYSVNEIGINAFNDSGIETITVDMKNVYWDFGYIDKLHTVIFTKNVESIDDGRYGPFRKCRNIERIVVEDGNKYYDSRNNCNALIGTNSNTLIFGCKNTIIPSGVTRIGDYAFSSCSGLVNINIPEGVTSIGEGAFYYCSGLVNINVPEGVTTIGSYAFQGSKLTSLLIPSSVTDIGYEVFSYCHSLRSLTFLGNIPNIRLGSEIVSLTLGPNVKSINKSFNVKKAIWLTNTPPTGYEKVTADVNYVANNQYTSLKNVIVYPFISSMFEVNGVKYVPVSPSEKTCDAIDCNYSQQVDSVNVGNSVLYKGVSMSVKQVCPYTFYANSFVKQVGLNYSGNIGSYALSECLALENVNIEIDGNVGRYAFYKSKLMKLEIARASKIDEYAFGSITNNFNAQINNNDDICANAFYQSTGLDSLFIGGNVNTIGDNAFNGCSSMRSVALSNVKTFGNNSFEGCSSLEKVVISDSTKLIGPYAFKGCSSLRELSIGSSVESIGTYAFSGCPELLKVEIPASVGSIDNYAFAGCEKINTIIFDDGTEPLVLGSNGSSPLFADCPLDTVYIGRNISYDATSAKGYSPFYRNTSLRAVEITDKETEISENEFYGCSKLKNVRIGDGVTTIGNWAFSGCASLDYFAFGRKVKNIGHESFSDCTNVTHLISRAPVPPTCGSQALDDINKWSCTLTVPKACLKSYQAADQWKEFFFMEEGFALEHTVTYIDGDSIVAKEIMSYGDTITTPVLNKEGYTFVGWSPKVPEVLGDDDLSFTAQWELNKYMLTYIVDGDTVKSDSIVYASALTLIDEPTKEGHTFSGWSELPQTMPAKDVVVTGTFTINSYLLTYIVDGDTVKSDSIVYASALTLIDEPTKEGYTFSGWSELPQTMPAKDVVVTGEFTINSYLLSYIVDGETVKSDSIAYGTALTLIDEPTKEGYTFSGWSELPQTMPAKDVVVTGTFTINSYLLSYKVDGETYKTETVAYGTALTLIDAPTKEGYTFSGWSELPQTMPAKDVVVTGTFTINSYQLTYTVDGETYKTETVVYGTALTLIDEPTKEGYTFSSWSELPQTMPAKDVVVTGTFNINSYVVTFKVDGKVIKSETLTYGAAITAPEDPAKEGYTFTGWSPEVDATVPANDVTYEAEYKVNVYAVIYMVNNEEWARDSVAYGEVIELKTYTLGEDDIFSGWTCEQDYTTMPAHDVVYTANVTSGIWSILANRQFVDVYNIGGGLVGRKMPVKELKKRLPRGIYIIEGRKVTIR